MSREELEAEVLSLRAANDRERADADALRDEVELAREGLGEALLQEQHTLGRLREIAVQAEETTAMVERAAGEAQGWQLEVERLVGEFEVLKGVVERRVAEARREGFEDGWRSREAATGG